jgi:hypothetical protein
MRMPRLQERLIKKLNSKVQMSKSKCQNKILVIKLSVIWLFNDLMTNDSITVFIAMIEPKAERIG